MTEFDLAKQSPCEITQRPEGSRPHLRAVPIFLALVLSAYVVLADGWTVPRAPLPEVLATVSSATIASQRIPETPADSAAKDCPIYQALVESAATSARAMPAQPPDKVVAVGRTLADSVTLNLQKVREQDRVAGAKQTPQDGMLQTLGSRSCPETQNESSRLDAEELERQVQEMEAAIPLEERVLEAEAESAKMWQAIRQSLPQVTDELILAYVRANEDPQELGLSCGKIGDLLIEVSSSDYEEILRCGWTPETSSRYDRGSGILHLSRPGFSTDGRGALVHLATTWHGLQGEAFMVFLRESDGEWKIEGSFRLWSYPGDLTLPGNSGSG